MASGLIGEAILIIASVIVAGSIAGVVLSQIGVFESTITETTNSQQDKLLTKINIIFASNTTDTEAEIWVKNVGKSPITNLDKMDVYFGPVGSVDRYSYSVGGGDGTWEFDGGLVNVWSQMDTVQINVTETSLAKGTTYEIRIITPEGVSDDYIYSIP